MNAVLFSRRNELKHPEGVQGNQPGVKPRSGATPGIGSTPLHPSRDARSCEITLPVVTLASLANHRLISVHPFGVSLFHFIHTFIYRAYSDKTSELTVVA